MTKVPLPKCDYCDSFAVSIITRIMQPSPPHYACKKCRIERVGKGYVVVCNHPRGDI